MTRQPRQARSQRTLDRLMDAAEELLAEKHWPDIKIQEIVARAGSSVGSFYARFENKRALFVALSERLSEQVAQLAEELGESDAGLSPADAIEHTIVVLIRFHHQRRGIIRALSLVPRLDKGERLEADGQRNADVFGVLAERLAPLSDDAEKRRLGLFMVAVAIKEAVVFPEISQHLINLDQRALARELSRALIVYLEHS